MRDELPGIVAHDRRDPVHNTIVMSAATRREIPLPDDQRARHLAIVERTAKGMNHPIADPLDVTRIESGSLARHRTPVDVGAPIDEMLELFAPQAQARHVALAGDGAPTLPPVPGDRGRPGARHRPRHRRGRLAERSASRAPSASAARSS